MCENRERLIGYVYGESGPDEKRAIEEHLTACHVCREEIRGLRSVRQDLLAWEVPSIDPIWRPVAPVRQESPWRAVPAWAMAAAASAMLMVGAAGGAATYALLPGGAPAMVQTSPAAPAPIAAAPVAPVDLSELEARLVARMRAELDERVQLAATRPAESVGAAGIAPSELARRVNILSSRQDELYGMLLGVANETDGIRSKQTGLERDNRLLVTYMQGQGTDTVFGGR
jgi:hypothetical protein